MTISQAAARDTAGQWSAQAIHDTVAAIARQRAYSTSLRESLLGRFFRFLFQELSDLLSYLHGSPNARWIVVTSVGAIVLVIVARIVAGRDVDDRGARRRAGRTGGDRTSADYWTEARALAGGGNYDAACHALYTAVLDVLARRGAVRIHPSKTSGDYSRELTRRGIPVAPAFRAFARQFERIVFGSVADGVSADDFERLITAAEGVMPSTAAA